MGPDSSPTRSCQVSIKEGCSSLCYSDDAMMVMMEQLLQMEHAIAMDGSLIQPCDW